MCSCNNIRLEMLKATDGKIEVKQAHLILCAGKIGTDALTPPIALQAGAYINGYSVNEAETFINGLGVMESIEVAKLLNTLKFRESRVYTVNQAYFTSDSVLFLAVIKK